MKVKYTPTIFVGLAVACIAAASASCGPGKYDEDIIISSFGWEKLLYVESVDFPDAMVENQPFDITIKVSALLDPSLLNGMGRSIILGEASGRFQFAPMLVSPSLGVVEMECWVPFERRDGSPIVVDEPPSDTALVQVQLPAGDYIFRVSTADARERGGMEGEWMFTPTIGPMPNEHAVYKEYPFTVLPAEAPIP